MERGRNLTFSILESIGITLVIAGHLDFNLLDIGGIFPYYSFHVMIFVFVAGYFYNPEAEDYIFSFIKRKFIRLMLPYFIWNVIYGIIAELLHCIGFSIGEKISWEGLLISPFMSGHQFMYNAPGWFVPALFLLHICNILGRRVLHMLKADNEWIILILYFFIGVTAVTLAIRGSVYDYYRLPARLMLMAFPLQLGRIYRLYEDRINKIPVAIMLCSFIVNLVFKKMQLPLAYSTVWASGFACGPVMPFITMITGIAFWLSIAICISNTIGSRPGWSRYMVRFFDTVGAHTFSIMLHHLSVILAIKGVFYTQVLNGSLTDFNVDSFLTDIYYVYTPGGNEAWKLIYLSCAMLIPLVPFWLISGRRNLNKR